MNNFILPIPYNCRKRTSIFLTQFFTLFAIICLVILGCREASNPLIVTDEEKLENTSLMKTGFDPNDPLMPTGNSTEDTENLQAALHDPILDAGGTLFLGPGTFRIHRFIGRQNFSDPSDPSYSTVLFNGTIQGSGKGVTILRGVRGPNGESFEPLHYEIQGFANDDHTLLGVVQTYIGVKDLTFESESGLVDPYNAYGDRGLITYVWAGSSPIGLNELIGTDIVNVHFKGSLNSSGNPEMAHQFQQWGDKGGVHNITNCDFENNRHGALQFFDLANATINVGGSSNKKVTFINAAAGAVDLYNCWNGNITVSFNDILNSSGGITCVFLIPNTQSTLVVEHNDMQNVGLGIDVRDYPIGWGYGKVVDVAIAYNKINLDGSGPWWGGAVYSRFVKDAVIRNNQVTGQVLASAINVRGEGNTLQANNIQNVTSEWGYPQIWLWVTSTNNLVFGSGNLGDNVFDEPDFDSDIYSLGGNLIYQGCESAGYDNSGFALLYEREWRRIRGKSYYLPVSCSSKISKNNILVGVNNMHVNVGQDIRNAIASGNFDEINLRKR